MSKIRYLVGDLNYYELQNLNPDLFPELVSKSENRSDYTDIKTWFIDNEYSHKDLLDDLKSVLKGKKPSNKIVYRIVLDTKKRGWKPSIMEKIIFVIVSIVIWILIFYAAFIVYAYFNLDEIKRENLYKNLFSEDDL